MEGARCWCNRDGCGMLSVVFGEFLLFFAYYFVYVCYLLLVCIS